MSILNYIIKNTSIFLFGTLILSFLSSCGGIGKIWDPADARKVPANVNERVQKNLEEGKGWSIKKATSGSGKGTNYEFATSNAHSWKRAGVSSGQIDSETHLCAVVGIGFSNRVHVIAKRLTTLSIGELFTRFSLPGS